MFEFFLEIDRVLFEFINGKLSNVMLDWLMPIITNAKTWIPLYIGLLMYMVYRYKKYFFIPFLGLLLSFGAADLISARVIKPTVQRTRPCNETTVNSRVVGVECRNSFGFPSSHASKHFAIAIFMIILTGTRKRFGLGFWLMWAIAISFSRIYVGVHYPGDVIGGALLGCIIGFIVAKATNNLLKKTNEHSVPS